MSNTTELIKNYAPLVTPFIPTIVEIFVKPKLQRLSKFLKRNDAQSLISVEAKFTEYLERSYIKHSFIPILIFQNQQRKLEDIYIPLTVRGEIRRERQNETFKINSYPKNFLPKYKKVLIRDTAGMGKSTLMKRLFLSCLEAEKGIPIFIELRKLKGDDSITSFIHRELNPINDEFDQDFILNLIKDGNFIFFLDGYDEISQSEREKVTINLHDFISKTGNNLFIMTSRPEISLASFPDFMEFDIQPLELEEAFTLLRKYDKDGELSAEIISKLEGDTLENIEEFLKNPLLVSLLYKSYDYKHTIPLKKHTFYRQVYDALFESHDLTKEGAYIRDKHCQLDSDSFHAVLRALGFITIKYGVEYGKDEILSFIKKAKTQCSTIEFKESKFLHDLLQTVPLFTKDGNYYRWSHKSLQDYFAAQFIWLDTSEKQSEILRKIVRSEENYKYLNVLDIYYDLDYKTFRQTVFYDFLSEFSQHFNFAFKFIVNTPKKRTFEIQEIRLLTFGKIFLLFPQNSTIKTNDFYDSKIESYTLKHANFVLPSTDEFLDEKFKKYRYFMKGAKGMAYEILGFNNHNYLLTKFLFDKKIDIFLQEDECQNIIERSQKSPFNLPNDLCIVLSKNSYIKHIRRIGLSTVNYILASHSNHLDTHGLLDSQKCKKMKAEIELEIEREKANDLYDNL